MSGLLSSCFETLIKASLFYLISDYTEAQFHITPENMLRCTHVDKEAHQEFLLVNSQKFTES